MPQTKREKRNKVWTERVKQIEVQTSRTERFPTQENERLLARLIRDREGIERNLDNPRR